MWNAKTPGIPDELFDRYENVPITKEEVRAVQISKARLKPGMTVYDIGCGSGSISVEASLQVEESGSVHAIDYDTKAVELTKKTFQLFLEMLKKKLMTYLMLMQYSLVELVVIPKKLLSCVKIS